MAPSPLTLTLTLTTIPPELLLQIISYLPSSTSLHALSLTSHSISSFLHNHASSICTTHIQLNPTHTRAASILKSEHFDGWLVPMHPCILEAEQQWITELASRSSSRAASPHVHFRGATSGGNGRGHGRTTTTMGAVVASCCFRTDSAGSGSTYQSQNEKRRAPRPRSRTSRSTHPTTQHQRQQQQQRTHQALTPTTRHTDLSLSLTLNLPLPFKLSRPGPHFLVFLERYSAEIVARYDMQFGFGRSTTSSSAGTLNQNSSGNPDSIVEEQDDRGDTLQFEFMLKLYCLRNWLVLCNNTFNTGDGEGRRVPYAHIFHPTDEEEDSGPSRLTELVEEVKDKIGRVARRGRVGIKKLMTMSKRKEQAQPTSSRRLLFGEIDTDSASSLGHEIEGRHASPSDSLGGSSSTTATTAAAVERDTWVKGLLWFYGVGSQFSSGGCVAGMMKTGAFDRELLHESGADRYDLRQSHEESNLIGGKIGDKVKRSWAIIVRRGRRFERLDEK